MKIVFDCGSGGPPYQWDGNSINDGIGGSEEAVAYMARELAALGHQVQVFNNCNAQDKPDIIDGVEWHKCYWLSTMRGDIYISWRNANPDFSSLDNIHNAFKLAYLYCHDVPTPPHWNGPESMKRFDKIIMLNEHHRKLYKLKPEQSFVCGNGVDVSQFEQDVERIPNRCIYISHPHRGLNELRRYWPKIREAVPDATLAAFWWQPEFFLPPNESIGILPMRKLGHTELAREILQSELFTYPSVFSPEINPISCIKAQCGGATPIVVLEGGMKDTLIPPYYACHHDTFADTVIFAMGQRDLHNKHREKFMLEARTKFDWRTLAKAWVNEFETELAK